MRPEPPHPSALRGPPDRATAAAAPPVTSASFSLEPKPPFRLDLTVWALRRRPHNRIDQWDGRVYQRVWVLADQPLTAAVTQVGPPSAPRLEVTLTGAAITADATTCVAQSLADTLGIDRDLTDFYALAAADPQLGPLVERFRGLKPPRFPTLYECLVNAITCQQITLSLGLQLLNRLAAAYGPVVANGTDGVPYGIPQPHALAAITPAIFRDLQFSRQKARALAGVAAAVAAGRFDPSALAREANATVHDQLRQLWGVGRWTAEYALLRGLGRLDVFPADDAGAARGLQRWLGLSEKLNYAGVHAALCRWQPYAGLIYFHLLLNGLDRDGHLSSADPIQVAR